MTCIVGLATKHGVYIGGDSAGIAGLSLNHRADEKVFINGGFVFGFTSSFRMGQVLRYAFKPPVITKGQSLPQFMATTFVDAVRESFKAHGFLKNINGEESGGTFIVGYKNKLFTIENDFQVAEQRLPYHAVGCGDQVALGALFTAVKDNNSYQSNPTAARNTVVIALKAAECFNAGVRAPFIVKCLRA